MNYQKMKIEDIINWCVANKEVAWLKAEAKKEVAYKVYPRVKVDGKMVVDKTAEPKTEMRKISFIQLKHNFCEKFMPELLPQKTQKLSMYDLIDAL